MFFDGALSTGSIGKIITRVGVVFVSPENHILPCAFSLTESCSNNVAENNALLIGVQLAQQIGVQYLKTYGESKLIVNQVKGEYEVRHEDLIFYHHAVIKLTNLFDGLYISHVSCLQNSKTDTLATDTLILHVNITYRLIVAIRHLFCPKHD